MQGYDFVRAHAVAVEGAHGDAGADGGIARIQEHAVLFNGVIGVAELARNRASDDGEGGLRHTADGPAAWAASNC